MRIKKFVRMKTHLSIFFIFRISIKKDQMIDVEVKNFIKLLFLLRIFKNKKVRRTLIRLGKWFRRIESQLK